MSIRGGIRVRSRQDGFTLVELLVAITLLALLSVTLLGGMRFGTQIWRASEEVTHDENRIRSVQLELTDMIERIYPEYVAPSATATYVDFDGGPHEMALLMPDETRVGSLNRVSIGVVTANDQKDLVSSSTPELSSDANTRTVILVPDIDALDFSYFGKSAGQNQPNWQSEWHQRSKLPDLIRIRIGIRRGRIWPDLVVAPRTAADVSCGYDPLTKFCRGRS